MTEDDIVLIPIEQIEDDDITRELEVIKEMGSTLNSQVKPKKNIKHYSRDIERAFKITNPEIYKERIVKSNKVRKIKYANQSPEERKLRLDKANEKKRVKWLTESPEETIIRKERNNKLQKIRYYKNKAKNKVIS